MNMKPIDTTSAEAKIGTRRTFFSQVGEGLYGAALAYLLGDDLFSTSPVWAAPSERVHDLRPREPHLRPKATSVIQFFMNGGPSQVDLFDPKPSLEKYAGKPPGRDLANDIEFINEAGGFMPSPFQVRPPRKVRRRDFGSDASSNPTC